MYNYFTHSSNDVLSRQLIIMITHNMTTYH